MMLCKVCHGLFAQTFPQPGFYVPADLQTAGQPVVALQLFESVDLCADDTFEGQIIWFAQGCSGCSQKFGQTVWRCSVG